MKRTRKILIIAVLLAPFIYVACKITVFNPTWMIRTKFPEATVQLHSINSPDFYFWPTVAAIFRVPMSDPDHSIMVQLSDHPDPIRLDDFSDADEVYITRSTVVDISGYWKPSVQISGAVFFDCDLDSVPENQRRWLKPYSDRFPNSFCVSYESKKKAEQGAAPNPLSAE